MAADFPALFDQPSAWNRGVDAFVLNPRYALAASDEDIQRVTSALARSHTRIGVAVGSVTMDNAQRTPGECGFNVEGMVRPRTNARIFARLKRLDVTVDFVALDEPLTFAYFDKRPIACHLAMSDVAKRVAQNVAEIRESYPDIEVIESEAQTSVSQAVWLSNLAEWLDAYDRATGRPLDGMLFDINWVLPWESWVRPSLPILHRAGARSGIFIEAAGAAPSDAAWVANAELNARSVQASAILFDIFVVTSWTMQPSRALPPSAPDTLTSLLKYWINRQNLVHAPPRR